MKERAQAVERGARHRGAFDTRSPLFPEESKPVPVSASAKRGVREEPGRGAPPLTGSEQENEALAQEEVQGVYIISVACRLLEMHPQTLRKYERLGLVNPSRTLGMLRLYSDEDIARLRLIKHLVEDRGMNLAGVEMALELVGRLADFRRRFLAVVEEDEIKDQIQQALDQLLSLLHLPFP